MAETAAPFDKLKAFNGLIHRQPIFIDNAEHVDCYQLRFFDISGVPLNDDAEIPPFLEELPVLVPMFRTRTKTLLTVPHTWQTFICSQSLAGLDVIIDLNGHLPPDSQSASLTFADHVGSQRPALQSKWLLVDLSQYRAEQLLRHIPIWREQNKQLCALNVDTYEQLQFCQQAEFDFIQGRFYIKPSLTRPKKLPPSEQSLMQLLVKLQEAEVEPDALAAIINQDVSLSYKLLRLINSAFFSLPKEVGSTKQAIIMLGLNKIKTWASLLCLSGMAHAPNEIRQTAMIRARMCELLAPFFHGHGELFFAAGLFSTLDTLMDKRLVDVLSDLPLSQELRNALLDNEGPAGHALAIALNYETANWTALQQTDIPLIDIRDTYLDALRWSKALDLELKQ